MQILRKEKWLIWSYGYKANLIKHKPQIRILKQLISHLYRNTYSYSKLLNHENKYRIEKEKKLSTF